MKVYTQTFDLAQPTPKAFSVAQYSDFGIGIKIVKNGVEVEDAFTLEKDGVTLTPEADKIAGYTVYLLTADGAANYTVTCNGQTFMLTQGVTDSTVIDYKPAQVPQTKYGASLDSFVGDVENGVLQLPTQKFAFETDEITAFSVEGTLASFKGNKQLSSVILPNLANVAQWGSGSFEGCTELKLVYLPNLSSVGQYGMANMFKSCTKLVSVSMPKLTAVQPYSLNAFCYGCSSLTSVNFNSLSAIDSGMNQAFYNCKSLEHVSMRNLTGIVDSETGSGGLQMAFYNCTNLKTVDFPKLSYFAERGSGTTNTFRGCTSLEIVNFSEATAVPTTPYNVATSMFYQTNNTFKIIVPDALYESWIADDFWSPLSAQITKVSDYAAVMTPYGGSDNMDD